ncbi:MAG: ROK family protein [Candidatus Saccharimonadales bacterium]
MLITVDTGGTKTLVATFNRHGKLVQSERFPTPKDPQEYIELVASTITTLSEGKELDAISVAVPGMVRGMTAVWCPNLGWENVPVGTRLKKHFSCPIFLENDANLAGLAETRALAHIPDVCLYVTVSTGIGTGIIVDGKLHPGFNNSEAGHMMLEYDGRMREWEKFASGRSIKSTYGKFARDIHDRHVWDQIADKISRGLGALIPLFNPEIIIIGGSIGTYFDRYDHSLRTHLRHYLNDHLALPEIRQAIHPEEAVIYGCYYYAVDQLDA